MWDVRSETQQLGKMKNKDNKLKNTIFFNKIFVFSVQVTKRE